MTLFRSLPLAIAAAFLLSGPAISGELKGANAVQAINGKSFNCNSGGLTFTLKFKAADPKGTQFPFTFKSSAQTVSNAFVLKKNGRFVSQNDNSSRRISTGKNGSIKIRANGRPDAICKAG